MNNLLDQPILLGLILLGIAVIGMLCLFLWLYFKMRRFLITTDAHSIADSLDHVSKQLDDVQEFKSDMQEYLKSVENRLQKSIQSVETVRFNPFKGTGGGGNQSFATTFLNQKGDGVVISSLYSRDHVSVFSKPIVSNKSEYELSQEEKQSLDQAKSAVLEKK